jgi:hypothetical protein
MGAEHFHQRRPLDPLLLGKSQTTIGQLMEKAALERGHDPVDDYDELPHHSRQSPLVSA